MSPVSLPDAILSRNPPSWGAGALASAEVLAACGDNTPTTTPTTAAAAAATNAATTTTAATTTSAATSAATTTAATTSATTTSAATTAAAVKAVTITHWDWWVTQGPAIDDEIKLFQQANPGITVKKVTNPSANYDDSFSLAQKSGDGPDTFLISSKTPNTFKDWANAGWLGDLTQFPDWNDFKSTFPNPTLNFVEGVNVIKGKAYSAPHDAPVGGMGVQMYVNTKVLKDAGIVDASGNAKLPVTADDVMQMSQIIKQKSGGKVYG